MSNSEATAYYAEIVGSCILILIITWVFIRNRKIKKQMHNGLYSSSSSSVNQYNINAGLAFEIQVFNLLKDNGYCHVLHNVIVYKDKKAVSQNDIIVICQTGIYILECKNWSGYIRGDYNWNRWIKVDKFRPYGRYTNSININAIELYNPINQNQYHVNILLDGLKANGFPNVPCYSLIVFNDSCNLSDVSGGISECVITLEELISRLRMRIQIHESNSSVVLTEELQSTLYKMLDRKKFKY